MWVYFMAFSKYTMILGEKYEKTFDTWQHLQRYDSAD